MIVDLTAAHLDECARLYARTFAAPPWNEAWEHSDAVRRLSDMLATPRAVGVCAVDDDGSTTGFVLGQLERVGAADHLSVREMCVAADRQREGWGTRLLDALDERTPGVEHWYLLTMRDGAAAGFYEANGFRRADRLAVYVRP